MFQQRETFIEKYFVTPNLKKMELLFEIASQDDELKITLFLDVQDDINAQNKKKLKEKIKSKYDDRYSLQERKKYLERERNISSTLKEDSRITQDMKTLYNKAKVKFGMNVPNPSEILDNKDKHVNDITRLLSTMVMQLAGQDKTMECLSMESCCISTLRPFNL